MTLWHRNEYVLKGLFLGLWTFFALQVPASTAEAWKDILWVLGWTGTGLLVGLILGTVRLMARGVKPLANGKAFLVLVLLENPLFIYAGTLIGLTAGVFSGREFAQPWAVPIANWFGLTWDDIKHTPPVGNWLGYCAAGGAVLGFGLYQMRQMKNGQHRFLLGLGAAVLLVFAAAEFVMDIKVPDKADPDKLVPLFESADARFNLGLYILLGLPFFYLLTFSGEAEESEVEIMTLCAGLGVALHLMEFAKNLGGAAAFLLPVALYFVYATRLLPGLRVSKHVIRGYSYMRLGNYALALRFFHRARQLDPTNPRANDAMHNFHYTFRIAHLESDPAVVEVLDFDLCLDRAERLFEKPPSPEARAEAEELLALVEEKKPAFAARIDYLRAVSFLHAKEYDAAAERLSRLLNPETPAYDAKVRKEVYFDALFLVLDGPKALTDRLGWAELNKPGRRMEAIAAVERQLATNPNDPKAQEYRAVLYSQLTEGEFVAASVHGQPKDFSYEYVEQFGYQLADDSDPERRDRGMAYLRIAGRGLPDRVPAIFKKLADVSEKCGNDTEARGYTERIAEFGKKYGPANFAKDQRDIYLKALQKLSALAEAEGDVIKAEADAADAGGDADTRAARDAEAKPLFEAAIGYLLQYLQAGGGAVLESYRKIAELYGKMRDALNAVLNTEHALTYDSTDADLLRKRDSYYYSVTVERLTDVKDRVGRWFDVRYCVQKAMSVLNAPEADADLLDWAVHLTRLAKVLEPTSNRVRFVEARCLLRRGDRDAGLQVLEDVSESAVGSGDEEESWYNTRRLLGQLYLDELNRPDLAVKAYLDYKKFHKSGADTLYQIAKCYEALGDLGNAVKFYNAVTVFEEHPRYYDAKDALRRLGKGD